MKKYQYGTVDVKGNVLRAITYLDGKREVKKFYYEPYLFVPKTDGEYSSLDGERLEKKNFSSIKDARNYYNEYCKEDSGSWKIDGKRVYGTNDFKSQWISEEFYGEIDYDFKHLSVVGLDIEVRSDDGFPDPNLAEKEITLIQLYKNGRGLVLGTKPWENGGRFPDIEYEMLGSEKELLVRFVDLISSDEWVPDIITGWNVLYFDVKYLINRMVKTIGEAQTERLSPWLDIEAKRVVRNTKWSVEGIEEYVFDIKGVTIIDYMDLYMKFCLQQREMYTLDHIAEVELEDKKVDYSEYGSIDQFYLKNYDKFVEYGIHDVKIVDRLEKKLGYINQCVTIAYLAKTDFLAPLGTVKLWDTLCVNYLMTKKIAVEPHVQGKDGGRLQGGYVKDVIPGMYEHVKSLDMVSEYPSGIISYNISPETKIGYLETFNGYEEVIDFEKCLSPGSDFIVSGSGCMFDKNKEGFLPSLMDHFFRERNKYKKLAKEEKNEELSFKYDNIQGALKVLLNSGYGALANRWFRFYDIDLARATTLSGQLSIRWAEKAVNKVMNKIASTKDVDYVIAIDTDSLYISYDKIVEIAGIKGKKNKYEIVDFIDKVSKRIVEPAVAKALDRLGKIMNVRVQRMRMNREIIADKMIFRARKMYVANILDKEGVKCDPPKLKAMGIEAVRSSTPRICREKIKDAMTIALNDDESALQKFVEKFKREYKTLPFEKMASPRSVNGMDTYILSDGSFKDKIPIAVRAAGVYNENLKKYNLTNKFETIKNASKIKFAYLKKPNPVKSHVIACVTELPKEFKLEEYIDYEQMFEKTFLIPIQNVVSSMGWSVERRKTFELQ